MVVTAGDVLMNKSLMQENQITEETNYNTSQVQ